MRLVKTVLLEALAAILLFSVQSTCVELPLEFWICIVRVPLDSIRCCMVSEHEQFHSRMLQLVVDVNREEEGP